MDKKEVLVRIGWKLSDPGSDGVDVEGAKRLAAKHNIPISDEIIEAFRLTEEVRNIGWEYSNICWEDDAADAIMGRGAWESSMVC